MTVKKLFAQRLRALREERGLSQAELADKLGVSRGSISFYENAERLPDIEVLHNITVFFDADADFLLGDSEIRSKSFDVAAEQIGLSENAINRLIDIRLFWDSERKRMKLLSDIICSEKFSELLDCLLRSIDAEELDGSYSELNGLEGVNITKEAVNEYALTKCARQILEEIQYK